jgi:Family of unknown function (DUF6502)
MVGNKQSHAIAAAVLRLLRPLVRILLRNGVPYGAFADIAKQAYVDIASKEFTVAGKKQTTSRVSIITGLTRKEVARIQKLSTPHEAREQGIPHNRAARVIGAWVRENTFQNASGEPALLDMDGKKSFSELVKHHSGDMPVRAVLDELVRVGAVVKTKTGKVCLQERGYIPKTGEIEKLGILGTDVAGLIATIDRNLQSDIKEPYFQRKVSYDALPESALPRLRSLTAEQGQALLEHLDRWMAEQDKDINPEITDEGRRRAGIGVYYFEESAGEEL